jgi:hypothetical protein
VDECKPLVAGSNEDDITMKLIQIIEVNNVLRQGWLVQP